MATIYLDTNVFAHAQAQGAADHLASWARARRHELLVSEVHVAEALAIKDPVQRAGRIDLLASLPARWLQPVGYLQSREVVNEVRRLRPEWRRLPIGDEGLSRSMLASHQQGWRMLRRRDRRRLEQAHAAYRQAEEPAIARSRSSQKIMREHLRGGQAKAHEVTLGRQRFQINPPLNLGRLDEFCRFESLAAWWGALFTRELTLADYANHSDPYLDLSRIDAAGFVDFWLKQVDLGHLPRGLSSSAAALGQLEDRITHGNAADIRHACYLPDAQLFITEDQAFQRALAAAARELALPEPVLISRGQPLLEQLNVTSP